MCAPRSSPRLLRTLLPSLRQFDVVRIIVETLDGPRLAFPRVPARLRKRARDSTRDADAGLSSEAAGRTASELHRLTWRSGTAGRLGGLETLAIATSHGDGHGALDRFAATTVRANSGGGSGGGGGGGGAGSSSVGSSATPAVTGFRRLLEGEPDDLDKPRMSPFSMRMLKPFIRRDTETPLLRPRLHRALELAVQRRDPSVRVTPAAPLDYRHLHPRLLLSVNRFLEFMFWPGIDVSEALTWPEFTVVALYRRLVVGVGIMGPDGYISFLAVHPEWQRGGLGTFILFTLMQSLPDRDVTLHVSAGNAAMILYQKFGFKPEEYIVDFYARHPAPLHTTWNKNAYLLRSRRV